MAWCPLAEPVVAPLAKCVRVSAVLFRINRTVAFICQSFGLRVEVQIVRDLREQ
jgi:hypothetical protein